MPIPPPRCSFVFGRPGEISGCSKSRVASQAGVRTLGESSFDVVGSTVAELVSKCDHLTHGDARPCSTKAPGECLLAIRKPLRRWSRITLEIPSAPLIKNLKLPRGEVGITYR